MTNHVARLYLLAASVLGFFVAWAGIAAHPWHARRRHRLLLRPRSSPTSSASADAALVARLVALRRAGAGGPGARGHAAAADDDPDFLMLRHHFRPWAPRSSSCSTRDDARFSRGGGRVPAAGGAALPLPARLGALPAEPCRRADVGPELLELAELAVAARERTAGRFDPTVHDAVAAAGYDRSFELIDVRRSRVRDRAAALRWPRRVDRAAARVTLEPGYRLDLGGIAKGWAADRVLAVLREAGPALVNAGGDVAVAGRPWPVGVDTADGTITLELDGGGLATSGCDRRSLGAQRSGAPPPDRPRHRAPRRRGPADRDRRRRHRRRGGGAREDPLPRRQRGAGARRGGSARHPRRTRHARRRDAARRRTRMKSDPTFWILARASGLMAYALLTSSVLAGLVLKARPFGRALRAAVVTDVHRFLALLGLGALVLHATTLVLDNAVHISLRRCSSPDSSLTGRSGRPAASSPAS